MPSASPISVFFDHDLLSGEITFGQHDDISILKDGHSDLMSDEDHEDVTVLFKDGDGDQNVEAVIAGTEDKNYIEEFQLQMAQESLDSGISHWASSNFDQALRDFMRCLEIHEDLRGRRDEKTAKAYLWVGTIYFQWEDYEKALDNFSRAYRIENEMAQGSKPCSIVINWINKTLVSTGKKSDYDKKLYWKKLKACIEHEKKGDELKKEKKFDRAIDSYKTAIEFEYLRRGLIPNTQGRPLTDCADLYFKVGRCYQFQGKYQRAIMEFRHAYSIYMDMFGPNQRYTLQTLDQMIEVAYEMGFRPQVAEEYMNSIYVSMRHEKTGDWMMTQNDYENALKEYHLALNIEGKYVGQMLASCATLYVKIGKVQQQLKRPQQALFMWCRALGIFESILGSQHTTTTSTMKLIQAIAL